MPDRIGIAVMARAPVPGQTKTRLIPRLGAEGWTGRLMSTVWRKRFPTRRVMLTFSEAI